MNNRIEILVMAIGLSLSGSGTLHAAESAPGKFSEASIGSVLALPVASLLLGGSVLFGFEGQGGLLDSVTEDPKPAHTKVAAVHQRPDGSREVELVAHETTETGTPVRTKILLPLREDGRNLSVAAGDSMDLTPSSGGAGWILHRGDGAAIAFLPTPQAQADVGSERF